MELTLVLGENGSGKSAFAERLAVEKGMKRFYIATMVPQRDEDLCRIERHCARREGKGFETMEIPVEISTAPVDEKSTVLLEDVSNLLANRMFTLGGDAVSDTLTDISVLAGKCASLIAVSISGLSEEDYSGETAEYILALNTLNAALFEKADTVYMMKNGIAEKIKTV